MSNTKTCRKTEQVLREFIELYRQNPCLWKIKSKEYSNKHKKEEAYKILVHKYQEINEEATKDDVVKKINSLRSCFRKEFKKVLQSKRSGAATEDVYTPSLWYFDLLLFLKDQEIPRQAVGSDMQNFVDKINEERDDEIHDDKDVDDEGQDDDDNSELEHLQLDISIPTTPQSAVFESSVSTSSNTAHRKRSAKKQTQSDSLLALVGEKLKAVRAEDEYDIIGKNVAAKLRKLKPDMKMFAEKLINDCLFEAQLESLNRNSYIAIPQANLNYPEHSVYTNLQPPAQSHNVNNNNRGESTSTLSHYYSSYQGN